jgi:hypothetical protein
MPQPIMPPWQAPQPLQECLIHGRREVGRGWIIALEILLTDADPEMPGEFYDLQWNGREGRGYGKKTVITDTGLIQLEVPRDRQARFDPQLIAKYQRRFPGFDDKIISM